ncbi:MAG: serine protein kinase RIO [Methanobrevibacter sp.]|jgi:RIO kinase 1|nr:serine protein kinase RIO [Candidatus Methanovirga aequatorialis]
MDSKIIKADFKLEKMESAKRIKDNNELKIGSEIFDKQTLQTLYKLSKQSYLDILNGAISTGKEANVLIGLKDNSTFVAVKIYRISTSDFRKMRYYIQGDPRFNVKSHSKRQLINAWVNKEFRNLNRAHENEVSVPKPITATNNILLLEFIGDTDGNPAQPVRNQKPEDPDNFADKVLFELKKFIHDAKLIHGDLSSFNILNHEEYPVIIDVSQSVVLDHPIACELLDRDILNLHKEFNKMKVKISVDEIKERINYYEIFK